MNTMIRLNLILLFLLSNSVATADEPHVSYIFPAGGQRGTTVSFHVGGHNLHDKASFEMTGSGIKASREIRPAKKTVWFEGPVIRQPGSQRKEDYPKDYDGEVKIDSDANLGFRRWRVATSQGVTPSMIFVVGDLPEIVEKEIDGAPVPVSVQTPVTINGRIFPREDVDVWTIECKAGESYACEVTAARLGSPLDSQLSVFDPSGQIVAENADEFGTDSFTAFVAKKTGTHQIRIVDEDFGGLQHYVYRLTIRSGPHVGHVYPLGGQRGRKANFQLHGHGLPTSELSLALPANEQFLTQQMVSNNVPSNPFVIHLGDLPELLEENVAGQTISLPATLNGAIRKAGEIDRWEFAGKKGSEWLFDVRASRLGSHLDSVLTVRDTDGKQLTTADDIAGGITDSKLKFKCPADANYLVEVADKFSSRGGSRFAYRLHVTEPAPPGFELELPADALTVVRGGEAKLKLNVKRFGVDDEITIDVEGLPEGVTVSGNKVAKRKTNVQLSFTVGESAKVQRTALTIIGTAKVNDQEVKRRATLATSSMFDKPDGQTAFRRRRSYAIQGLCHI